MTNKYLKTFLASLLSAGALGAASANAAVCDLTASTGLSCNINNALFENPVNDETVGTGVIDPFLTIQKDPIESGLNTDADPVPYDAKRGGGGFTKAIQVRDVGIVDKGGTDYLEFLLDTNEPNSSARFIKLLELRIYTGGAAMANVTDVNDPGLTLRYDLDAGGDNQVNINDNFNNGSGKGWDVFIYVPIAAFVGHADDQLVLWAKFGDADKKDPFTSDGGFEEFSTDQGKVDDCPKTDPACDPNEVPEPGILSLLGLVLVSAGWLGLSRRRR